MNIVEGLYSEFQILLAYLNSNSEISMSSLADTNLKKNLILSSASYFEVTITNSLTEYFAEKSNNSFCIKEFLVNKGLKRQYHTLFDWEKNNANTFFAFFGQDFKFFMEEKVKNDDSLNSSIKNFLEIGRERNRLVHQNFGNYNIEKTLEEIFESYKQSLNFTTKIIDYIEEYHNL
jgi:hypothetical protein